MDRSLLSRPSSSKHSRLSASSHELPRWRTPSPMAASIIPPPIVASTYAIPQRPAARSVNTNRPTPHQDRQSELEADLQYLLDAQVDGLLGGFESGLIDDRGSNGSTTPTTQSVRSGSMGYREKRTRRKPGVRSARKGIYNSIIALSTVKAEEIEDIDEDIRLRDYTIEKIDGWERKKRGLQEASDDLGSKEDTVRSQRLRQEADVLQQEINHVELQLADMKARQRRLLREAAAAENAVQAKMASYTSSLRLLEDEVQKYLSSTPAGANGSRDQSTSIWQLPPRRRTLNMAKQYWEAEKTASEQQRMSVGHEKVALDDGATVWKDVVVQITEFERILRTDMAKRAARVSAPEFAEDSSNPEQGRQCSEEVLEQMDRLIAVLQEKMELSQEQHWNPLIAAIGAEIDALKRGRQLLGGNSSSNGSVDEQHASDVQNGDSSPVHDDGGLHVSEQSFATVKAHPSNTPAAEDDPDPELLFSKHELDSE